MARLLIYFLAWVLQNQHSAFGLRCYVCTGINPDRDLMEMYGQVKKCQDFQRSKKDEFIKLCPPGYQSCLTKFESQASVIRQCGGKVAIDDVKEINHVVYSYCKAEICNSPDQMLPDVQQDDEDFSMDGQFLPNSLSDEGSGYLDYAYDDVTETPEWAIDIDDSKVKDVERTETVNDIEFEHEKATEKITNPSSSSSSTLSAISTSIILLILWTIKVL